MMNTKAATHAVVGAGLAVLAAALACCGENIEPARAVATMTSAGYKDVVVKAKHGLAPSFYGCSDSDDAAFDMAATNAAGEKTTAIVCCGWGFFADKACTIRH